MNMDWMVSLAGGAISGGFYFGALWFTVQRLATAQRPTLLLLASFIARASVVVLGLYLVMDGRWERPAACLAGFLLARTAFVLHVRGVGEASVSFDRAKGPVA